MVDVLLGCYDHGRPAGPIYWPLWPLPLIQEAKNQQKRVQKSHVFAYYA